MSIPDAAAGDLDLLTIGETMALVTADPADGFTVGAAATLGAGGAESNVAIAAAAQGLRTAWFSRIGRGPLGALVLESVRSRGVDTSTVVVDDARPTGLMLKHPAPSGSTVHYYRAGSAASALSPADLTALPSASAVHVSGISAALSESCRALLRAVVHRLTLEPARVSFDVNYRPVLWEDRETAAHVLLDLAQAADVVFVGRDEAEALWDAATAEDVRRMLPDVPHLVVKDGAVEAVEFSAGDVARVPARRVEVVEPVGAGDAFAAGWLAAWLRGADATARLASGHAQAAAVLTSTSDQAPVPAGTAHDRTTVS